MRSTYGQLFAVLMTCSALSACGGGSDQTGLIHLSASEFSALRMGVTDARLLSPRAGFNFRLDCTATLRETGGVGATLTAMRLTFRRGTTEIERVEISAADLITRSGTNRVAALSTVTLPLSFDFNSPDADVAEMVPVVVDDNGHSFTATGVLFNFR